MYQDIPLLGEDVSSLSTRMKFAEEDSDSLFLSRSSIYYTAYTTDVVYLSMFYPDHYLQGKPCLLLHFSLSTNERNYQVKFKERLRINYAESGTYVVYIYENPKQRFTKETRRFSTTRKQQEP